MSCSAFRRVFVSGLVLATMIMTASQAYCSKFSGEISQIKGTVEVQKTGRQQWLKAINGLPVQLKDKIRTRQKSSCNLELDDGSLIFVDQNTKASVEFIEVTQERHSSTLGLWFGKLLSNVKKNQTTKMNIKCPSAVISVRGTEFAVEVGTGTTDVGVFEGEVAVSTDTGKTGEELDAMEPEASAVSVRPDEQTTVVQGEAPKPPTRLSLMMQKNRDKMNELRGRADQLREKLKRARPESMDKVRQKALDRFLSVKEEKNSLKERIKNKRDQLR